MIMIAISPVARRMAAPKKGCTKPPKTDPYQNIIISANSMCVNITKAGIFMQA